MKKLLIVALTFVMTLSLITPAAAASEIYTVPKKGSIKAGVYENGKLLIGTKNTKEVQPIADAVRVQSTIFYTDFLKGERTYQCGGVIAEYNLKMKNGKSNIKTLKDRISNFSRGLTTDGSYLYYAAITSKYTSDLVRLSKDGKTRRVLVKGIEDVWYAQGNLYYVKNQSIHRMNPKTLKSSQLSVMKGFVYAQGPCNGSSYWLSPNAIMFENSDLDEPGSKTKTHHVYEYRTKKTHTLKVKGSGSEGYVIMVDVDLKNKRYLNIEFDGENEKLVLVDYNGKKIKDIQKLTNVADWKNSLTTSRYFERVDGIKKQVTYVNGTKLITKRF